MMCRPIWLLLIVIVAAPYATALDALDLVPDTEWDPVEPETDAPKGWQLRMFRHRETGDLLTIAADPVQRDLRTAGSLDRAMEFAPSGFPYWIEKENRGYTLSSLRLDKTSLSLRGERVRTQLPVIFYTMVNEDESEATLMAHGLVFVISGKTYYVQHTSRKPIRDWFAKSVVKRLHARLGK